MIKINRLLICLIFMFIFAIGCSKARYQEISSAEEFDTLFEGALKYDIRSTTDCEKGHIPGFICMGNMDADQIIETISITVKNKDRVIIIIGNADDIEYIFKKLTNENYKFLYTFTGGYEEYVNQKGPNFIPEEGCDC